MKVANIDNSSRNIANQRPKQNKICAVRGPKDMSSQNIELSQMPEAG